MVAGTYQVVASVTGATDVPFGLTNTPGAAATVTITGGDGQSAAAQQPLGQPLIVSVVDAFGNPVSGVTVTLDPPDPSGPTAQLTDSILTTGSDGTAQTTATAGTHAGSYVITASITGSTVAFHLSTTAGPPAVVTVDPGSTPQSTTVLTAFAQPLEVTVDDAFGNPCINTQVAFAAPATGASATFSAATVTTDSSGNAQTTATANATTGAYAASATVTGIDPAAFSLTNLAGSPTQVTAENGDGQSAIVDTDFASSLTVLLMDGQGNPVPNASVTFTAPGSGATAVLSTSTVMTDATGQASVTVHAGTVTGTYTVTATTAGAASPAQFTLTNTPDVAASITPDPGSTPQSATVGTSYTAPLTALVVDKFGNGVPGQTVTFAVPSTGASGTLSSLTAVTDATGKASVTITANTTAGSYAVTASCPGVAATASFSLSNLSGDAQIVSVRSGSQQSAAVATAFGAPLIARVQDKFGNPVVGADVTFQVPSSDPTATLSLTTVATNASGDATTFATASTLVGSYSVTASTPQGATPVTFALTNTPGGAGLGDRIAQVEPADRAGIERVPRAAGGDRGRCVRQQGLGRDRHVRRPARRSHGPAVGHHGHHRRRWHRHDARGRRRHRRQLRGRRDDRRDRHAGRLRADQHGRRGHHARSRSAAPTSYAMATTVFGARVIPCASSTRSATRSPARSSRSTRRRSARRVRCRTSRWYPTSTAWSR